MQIQNIQRPKLFSDFFNLELVWSNDYLEYIHTNNHYSVTSLLNTIKNSLNKKIINIFKYAKSKNLSQITLTLSSDSSKELSILFKKIFNDRAYRGIDKSDKCYFRFNQSNNNAVHTHVNFFVPNEHVNSLAKAINRIQKTATT